MSARRPVWRALRLIALLAASTLAGCRADPAQVREFQTPRRVFLVSIDTLRADHLSFYGYPRETAPFLARLAGEGAVFLETIAAASGTSPAHASLMTGLYPPGHKVLGNWSDRLPESIRTLAEVFRAQGFATGAVVSVKWLECVRRGFDSFVVPDRRREADSKFAYAPATRVIDHALEWLASRAPDERFLLWVHVFDPHFPLIAPEPFQARMTTDPEQRAQMLRHWTGSQGKDPDTDSAAGDLDAFVRWQSQYDAEIAYADSELERLYTTAMSRGLLEDSLWVITADHGEGLGNHDYDIHLDAVYQEQLRIPLIVHAPGGGVAPARIGGLARQVDVFPTLLEAIGASLPEGPPPIEGRSLLPVLRGEADRAPATIAFSVAGNPSRALYAVQDGRHKLIVPADGKVQLYDLARDPGERADLAASDPPLRERWRELAAGELERLTQGAAGVPAPGVTDENTEQLRALGYVE